MTRKQSAVDCCLCHAQWHRDLALMLVDLLIWSCQSPFGMWLGHCLSYFCIDRRHGRALREVTSGNCRIAHHGE